MLDLQGLADFLARLAAGGTGMTAEEAADQMEAFGNDLRRTAAEVRRRGRGPYASGGGMGDRVHVRLVGPDGAVKSHTIH